MSEGPNYNEELRAALERYRQENKAHPMTMSELGRELGMSSTRVNKYLLLHHEGKEPEGNVAELETRVADLLKAASRRMASDVPLFETNVVKMMKGELELIRKTNDVGLIFGPAGIGKGVAIEIYLRENPTAIGVEIPKWRRTEFGVAAILFDAVETSSWRKTTPKAMFLEHHLRHSNRLLIFDNAQRLTQGGREWIFDFHDRTKCPVAFVGHSEIIAAFKDDDQLFSRIGAKKELRLGMGRDGRIDRGQIRDYARKMVEAKVEKVQDGLLDHAATVAEQSGHLRALRKQLDLMIYLAATEKYSGDQVKAFEAAHRQLLRNYDL